MNGEAVQRVTEIRMLYIYIYLYVVTTIVMGGISECNDSDKNFLKCVVTLLETEVSIKNEKSNMDIKKYVYVLKSMPADSVIYVGKGTNKRYMDHFYAIKNYSRAKKYNKMRDLLRANSSIEVHVLEMEDDIMAFAYEGILCEAYCDDGLFNTASTTPPPNGVVLDDVLESFRALAKKVSTWSWKPAVFDVKPTATVPYSDQDYHLVKDEEFKYI